MKKHLVAEILFIYFAFQSTLKWKMKNILKTFQKSKTLWTNHLDLFH